MVRLTPSKKGFASIFSRMRIRGGLAAIAVALAILALGFAATDKLLSVTSFDATPYFDAKKAGIDIRLDHSKSYFEMTLLTLGALWALIVGQKDETRVRLSDWPEAIMLVSASSVLLLSIAWHDFYLDAVSSAYAKAVELPGAGTAATKIVKMPDVFQSAIDGLLVYQTRFFLVGVLLAVFALISAHNLKEES